MSACSTFKSTKPVASWLHIWLFSFELRKRSFKVEHVCGLLCTKKVFFCHLMDQGINHYIPNIRTRID